MSLIPGPGWINDIFDTRLEFDTAGFQTVPDKGWFAKEGGTIRHFDGKGTVSGKLYVAAPEGRTVSHNGIEICFKSTCHGPNGSHDVVCKTWTLLDPGALSEAMEIGFDIDLAEIKVLRDSFNGEVCQLRHAVSYRIVRPWYTFSVRGEEPLLITNAALPETAPPEPTETTLTIDDFGGVCVFDHGKCTFSADGRIVGSIAFSEMASTATQISTVTVLVGRTEFWSKWNCEDAPPVRVHVLHDAKQMPIASDVTIPVDIALTAKGSEEPSTEGPLPPSIADLTPEDPECDADNVFKVVYWVRLMITEAVTDPAQKPRDFWSTHPILLLPNVEGDTI